MFQYYTTYLSFFFSCPQTCLHIIAGRTAAPANFLCVGYKASSSQYSHFTVMFPAHACAYYVLRRKFAGSRYYNHASSGTNVMASYECIYKERLLVPSVHTDMHGAGGG